MAAEDAVIDDFSAAFAELTLPGEKPAPDTPAAEEAPAVEPVAEITAAEPAAEPVAETAVAPVVEPVAEVAPPVVAPAPVPPTDAVLDRLDAIAKKLPEPVAPAPAPAPEIFTPEEKTALTQYEADYPDVARGESIKRRGEYMQLTNYMFEEFAKHLKPLMEQVQVLSEKTHFADLRTEIPDYDQVSREKIVDWVATQPAYLQVAYNHVIQNGDTSEVKDLLTRYRQATGVVPGASAPPTAPAKKDTELPSATKQAVASLAPVSSKRSAVTANIASDDFEGAFATFAAKLL